ncbi:MAG: glycosyltransferase family 2 protein [Candidatus Merdivicinus sp.]|jgi:glycosyltransferase involved in cell wall biosynthesis
MNEWKEENGQPDIKVSVIIPVYQVENYLERAIDSVLAQTLQEKEIILVDDGSEDNSPEICDRYAAEYPEQIRVIHKQNEGLGMARNSGLDIARGEYVAFLDSDDTVEPEMYAAMYAKASAEDCDIVMCDVRILYVDENRTSVVSSYPREEVDLSDYIANGNNITYSVNKIYRRSLWEENRYEKMLFEDIALIPALVTRTPKIGYVKEAFYNYYRRSNTISTSFVGQMVDILRAFRNFLENSDPQYREETVYCIAKQLYWNMTQSRILFQADFIEFLKKYQRYFRMNSYLEKDKKTRKILDFLEKDVIPERFICVHLGRPIPEEYLETLQRDFPQCERVFVENYPAEQMPDSVRKALDAGEIEFAEEYIALKLLSELGGIVLKPEYRANLNLKRLRLNPIFFGFENDEDLTTGCYGSLQNHYVIQSLLDTYCEENIYNKAFLPLADRIRDFLILHFGLRSNGRKQLLKKEISVYLPSILAYDMKDGENCCKRADIPVPEGFEAVSERVLKMWSDRILENWNLYKQERNGNQSSKTKVPEPVRTMPISGPSAEEVERRIREVAELYENSTSWRITKPLRTLAAWLRR